jgi:integrase
MSDVRIAPNIYRTPHGFRVYHREIDPVTGRSKKVGRRFGPELTLPELEAYRDGIDLAVQELETSGFTADARRYLALTKVATMPSFAKRKFQIEQWIGVFGDTRRAEITSPMMNAALHEWRTRYSAASCNKFRSALMSLYTELDGRGAANPVKHTDLFEEAPIVPRGFDYGVLTRILEAVADHSKARARLEVLLWTGMDPSTLGRMTPAEINLAHRHYTPPLRQKGNRRRRTPRTPIPLPMEFPETVAAFTRLFRNEAFGAFDASTLWQTFQAACRRVERDIQQETQEPQFRLPHIRLKDLRHSFGTLLYEHTGGDLRTVAEMLQHAPGSAMTNRYALAAVSPVLRSRMREAANSRPLMPPTGGAKVATVARLVPPHGTTVVPLSRKS